MFIAYTSEWLNIWANNAYNPNDDKNMRLGVYTALGKIKIRKKFTFNIDKIEYFALSVIRCFSVFIHAAWRHCVFSNDSKIS